MHSKSACESLLTLQRTSGSEWFASTTGYLIVRSLFEVDVTAHYISQAPIERSRRYIDFEHVIQKKTLEKLSSVIERVEIHLGKKEWNFFIRTNMHHGKIRLIRPMLMFARNLKIGTANGLLHGRERVSTQWPRRWTTWKPTKSFMPIFPHSPTSTSCSPTDFFDQKVGRGKGPLWSQRADEFDVGQVFQYAASFLTPFWNSSARSSNYGIKQGFWIAGTFPKLTTKEANISITMLSGTNYANANKTRHRTPPERKRRPTGALTPRV